MVDPDAPVLVGVDGSTPGVAAIDLGIREARLHRRPLRLVHAFAWPPLGAYLGPSPAGPPDAGLAADADRILAEAREYAAGRAPELTVTGEVIPGGVAPVLLAEALRAERVVLGDRGLGGFSGLLLGSVAVQVSAHAPGPVLIARGTPHAEGPVVVGVAGSPSSEPAVEFAFAEATARETDLVALRTWYGRLPVQAEQNLPLIYDADDVRREVSRTLAGSLAGIRRRYPGLPVREDVQYGRAARTLVERSESAQLVVLGTRGRGGFTGLLLGSVSQAVLHHARCPVALVRRYPAAEPDRTVEPDRAA